jgi:hypothetical protein
MMRYGDELFAYDYDVLNVNSELADAVQASVEESAPV